MLFEPGELVLVTFPFTGESGAKQRPALVLNENGDDDVLLARVTTKSHVSDFDIVVDQWKSAGLLAPSTIRVHKIATLEKRLIRRRLGRLAQSDLTTVWSAFHRIGA